MRYTGLNFYIHTRIELMKIDMLMIYETYERLMIMSKQETFEKNEKMIEIINTTNPTLEGSSGSIVTETVSQPNDETSTDALY